MISAHVFFRFVVKSLQAIGKDEHLVMEMIHHLFDIINNSQLYDEKVDAKKGTIREACHVPMSVTFYSYLSHHYRLLVRWVN